MSYDFPPLTTDYTVEWDTPSPGNFEGPGEHYEHGYIHLDNGYRLSVLRVRRNADEELEEFVSVGFEDGLWEVGIMRAPGPYAQLMGMEGEPAPELQHIADELNGPSEVNAFMGVIGNVDSAGVSSIAALVSEQPAYNPDDHDPWQPPLFDPAELAQMMMDVTVDDEG